jgi:hypothetical protein
VDLTLKKLDILGSIPFFGQIARWGKELLEQPVESGQPAFTPFLAERIDIAFNGNIYDMPPFSQALRSEQPGADLQCREWLVNWINETFDNIAAIQPLT